MSDEKLPQEENETKIPTPETAEETKVTSENSETNDAEENILGDEVTEKTAETKVDSEEAIEVSNVQENNSEVITAEENSETNTIDEEAIAEEKKSIDTVSEEGPGSSDKASDDDPSTAIASEDEEAPSLAEASESEDEEEVASSEDEEDEEEHEEKTQKDYSTLSEKELVAELDNLLKTKKIQELKHDVEEIRSEFNNLFNEELEHKKEEFLAEGGNIIDFHYTTALKKEFNSLYFDYKEKRNSHYRNLKKDLQANIDKRWELIEELKSLLSAEENINTTYKHFKDIQEKWHVAGAIPRDKYNTVWNTYHHHVENFYDFLHLNREFRDLDFKHNLDSKLKIITRAEELGQEVDINKAFRELQMLHKMWKEDIGPVAKEYRDEVWDKFSEATKVIHDKRQSQLAEVEKDFEVNYEKKKQLVEEINKVIEESKPSHQGWQNAIKKVQELRDAFFNTGRVPRANNKEIWKAFKDATGNFNHQKNSFYKNQKKEQYTNLEQKRELIKIAEDNQDSEDFDATTALMKKIQDNWKSIGHVPRKDSDKIWKRFKKACNHYFDRLHAQKNEANQEEMVHFEAKQEMLEKLSSFELSGDHKTDVKTIKEHITAWKEIGRVPYNKRNIEQKFNKMLDGLFSKLDLGKKETELIKFDNKLNTLVNREDDRKLQNEHFFISKKIDETRDEIRQLENNLGFFRHVPDDNPMVKEVHKNIEKHKEQLEVWKAKLSKIKQARED
ncbi:DUF349 domain-containing protein [Aequorivita antarctica]|uniref:DUF349 domain-containing protein n=1 Tax=Aequorivita antarctica TaxID=153266 RepID=A0A5C6YXW9_9FLAO|nr:DUF349 domain-containing protein [Aequorivita antarctica]TXD72442.1 DUF349 domain-containing protein [Aequorivita antarctica]SRX75572.1 hypothetical protein AEQU3_02568 [Aequorivita antarctica]